MSERGGQLLVTGIWNWSEIVRSAGWCAVRRGLRGEVPRGGSGEPKARVGIGCWTVPETGKGKGLAVALLWYGVWMDGWMRRAQTPFDVVRWALLAESDGEWRGTARSRAGPECRHGLSTVDALCEGGRGCAEARTDAASQLGQRGADGLFDDARTGGWQVLSQPPLIDAKDRASDDEIGWWGSGQAQAQRKSAGRSDPVDKSSSCFPNDDSNAKAVSQISMPLVICRRYEEKGRSKKTKAEASTSTSTSTSTRIKQRAPRCRCVMVYVGLAQQESGAEGGGHGRREGTHDGKEALGRPGWSCSCLHRFGTRTYRSGTCPETQS
ncbi:hypothetical protein E5D57_012983 [Metarhizium anisopliae]|nr:hypothetical protein E5D57_012983 [Metarhizium anisopliae]